MVLGEDLEKPSPAQTALYTLEYALRGKIIGGVSGYYQLTKAGAQGGKAQPY